MGRVWDIAVLLSCISVTASLVTTLPKLKIPEECQHRSTCENVDNYPTELAKKLIEQLKNENVIFNNDEGQEATTSDYSAFHIRFEDEEETEQKHCDSRISNVAPLLGRHENGNWKYILNDGSTQKFRAEICDSLNATCNGEFVPGVTPKCIQNYILKEMYYIDDREQPQIGYIQLESCCSCVLINE